MTFDDKVSIRHAIMAEVCKARDTRATGLSSTEMNPAAAPVQLDIPSSNTMLSSDWVYNTHNIVK